VSAAQAGLDGGDSSGGFSVAGTAAAATAVAVKGAGSEGQVQYCRTDMLERMSHNADLEYHSSLHRFQVIVSANKAKQPKRAAAQQAEMTHQAKLLAVAVTLRQLFAEGHNQDDVLGSLGLQDVVEGAYAGKATFSSSSTALNALFAGRMPGRL
jgi:hypothetical protein